MISTRSRFTFQSAANWLLCCGKEMQRERNHQKGIDVMYTYFKGFVIREGNEGLDPVHLKRLTLMLGGIVKQPITGRTRNLV